MTICQHMVTDPCDGVLTKDDSVCIIVCVEQINSSVGKLVAEARIAAGLSQAQLAGAAGLSRPGLSLIENDRRDPGVGTFLALAYVLGMTIEVSRKEGRRVVRAVLVVPEEDRGVEDAE